MNDGIVELDSEFGNLIGFTSDRFDGYLWKDGNRVTISFIVSRAKGNFGSLVNKILGSGYSVAVPTPLGRMEEIVKKNGYRHEIKPFSDDFPEPCDVWVLDPRVKNPVDMKPEL